jgi:hypothetical protein
VVSAGFAADEAAAPLSAQSAKPAGATFDGPASTAAQIQLDEAPKKPIFQSEVMRYDYDCKERANWRFPAATITIFLL